MTQASEAFKANQDQAIAFQRTPAGLKCIHPQGCRLYACCDMLDDCIDLPMPPTQRGERAFRVKGVSGGGGEMTLPRCEDCKWCDLHPGSMGCWRPRAGTTNGRYCRFEREGGWFSKNCGRNGRYFEAGAPGRHFDRDTWRAIPDPMPVGLQEPITSNCPSSTGMIPAHQAAPRLPPRRLGPCAPRASSG